MDDSILDSIKSFLGISSDDYVFDSELILLINSTFMTLQQIGVGSQTELFQISDNTSMWSDYIEEIQELPMVKTYVAIKVKLIFDPPQSSVLEQALKQEAAECEWRLNVKVDNYSVEEDDEDVYNGND